MGPMTITPNLSQNIWWPGKNSNPVLPEYKPGAILLFGR
jgi:hypothetical protein